MNKIDVYRINETIYHEKLKNGLNVYFCVKENCQNVYATFTTKFGSMHKTFVPNKKNKMITVPNGVAHFLEHKIFAQEKGEDVSSFYEKSGTSYNAHTSLKNTTYEVNGPNNVYENVIFLLDYVQSPYFTEENIEVEKGIIKEEINMCKDNPWNTLYDKIRYNAFNEEGIKNSIAGEISDINKITKELLYDCYNTFYHPTNMFLVVTGNFDKDKLLQMIKDNQENKEFEEVLPIKIKKIDEKDNVYKEKEIIKLNTNIAKYAYNIKIPFISIKGIPKRKIILYLYIIFNILFDDTSEFSYNLKEKGIITQNIAIDMINTDKHILISLINETNNYKLLGESIKETLSNINIHEKDLNRKKKVFISNELFGYENIVTINDIIVDNILFDGSLNEDVIKIIESLNIKELTNLLKELNLSNTCEIVVTK